MLVLLIAERLPMRHNSVRFPIGDLRNGSKWFDRYRRDHFYVMDDHIELNPAVYATGDQWTGSDR
ncbi:hypothetical protein N7454_006444 [Penicillium verhagenii]|nr:hypothetical protein N7454_006444 [Penicillium verhagenii]